MLRYLSGCRQIKHSSLNKCGAFDYKRCDRTLLECWSLESSLSHGGRRFSKRSFAALVLSSATVISRVPVVHILIIHRSCCGGQQMPTAPVIPSTAAGPFPKLHVVFRQDPFDCTSDSTS